MWKYDDTKEEVQTNKPKIKQSWKRKQAITDKKYFLDVFDISRVASD